MPQFARLSYSLFVLFIGTMVLSPPVTAESHWPRFRGPDGSGHCQDTDLPTRWDAGDVKWRTGLDGEGNSSACVWSDRIFLTSAGVLPPAVSFEKARDVIAAFKSL